MWVWQAGSEGVWAYSVGVRACGHVDVCGRWE